MTLAGTSDGLAICNLAFFAGATPIPNDPVIVALAVATNVVVGMLLVTLVAAAATGICPAVMPDILAEPAGPVAPVAPPAPAMLAGSTPPEDRWRL